MSARALMTGVTGFIGGRLARHLVSAGWEVHALSRGPLAPSQGNVTAHRYAGDTAEVLAAVDHARPDVIFHLASLYLADHRTDQISDLIAANVLLTGQLAEAASLIGGACLLNTGTAWQNLDGETYLPVNLYAATKQAGADLLRYYHAARGLPVLTLKLFDTYGPGDTRRKLVQLLVEAVLRNEPLGLSPGEQRIDLTHVDDVVMAFASAAHHLRNGHEGTYFVGGDRLSVRELTQRVGRALGRPVPARFGERPYRPREVMEPAPPLPLLPGWAPRIDLDDGIRELATRSAP